jgi:hypothetical protein
LAKRLAKLAIAYSDSPTASRAFAARVAWVRPGHRPAMVIGVPVS